MGLLSRLLASPFGSKVQTADTPVSAPRRPAVAGSGTDLSMTAQARTAPAAGRRASGNARPSQPLSRPANAQDQAPRAPRPPNATSPSPKLPPAGRAGKATASPTGTDKPPRPAVTLPSAGKLFAATWKGDANGWSDAVYENMVATTEGVIYRSAASMSDPAIRNKVEAAIGALIGAARAHGGAAPSLHPEPVNTGYLHSIRPSPAAKVQGQDQQSARSTVLDSYGLNIHQTRIAEWVYEGVNIGASDIEYSIRRGVGRMRVKWHGALTPVIEVINDADYARKIRSAAWNLGSNTGNVGSFSEVSNQYRRIPGNVITKLPEGKILEGIRGTFMANNIGEGDGTMQLRLFARGGDGLRSLASQGWHPDAHLPLLRRIQALSGGLTVFTGEVGHGKTTALAAMLIDRYILRGRTDKIVTIQDLIEIPLMLDGVEISDDYQLPVKADQSVEAIIEELLAFVHRANPSTLMVNEAKDRTVWAGIVRCLLNGTKTFTTNHAKNCLLTPAKLRDLQGDDLHIFDPENLPAIAAQRLAPVVCPHCGLSFKQAEVSKSIDGLDALRARLIIAFTTPVLGHIPLPHVDEILDRVRFANPRGCTHCRPVINSAWASQLEQHMSGTVGRSVIGEVVLTDRKMLSALRDRDIPTARKRMIDEGGSPMQRHALFKLAEGMTDPREVEKLFGELDRFHLLTDDDDHAQSSAMRPATRH